MQLVQLYSASGQRCVAQVDDNGSRLRIVKGISTVQAMALEAWRERASLADLIEDLVSRESLDYQTAIDQRQLLPPLDHPDPAHCFVTGTGLTHLGSAKARDDMHATDEDQTAEPVSDSMRLFQWGIEGGKASTGPESVQPEWFYKGNGHCLVAPEHDIPIPGFALDAGEEPELVGLYVVADDGDVLRVGFAIGNEVSDHVMERQNYLYLAHSKLRCCSFGPELNVGPLPEDIQGEVRVLREEEVVWSETFYTGEKNMSYRISNLEHHHFKYGMFREPGDVHCHFLGTSTLSFASGFAIHSGDLLEISAPTFGRPLRNHFMRVAEETPHYETQQL